MIKSLLWPFSRQNKFYSEAEGMEKHHGGVTFLAFIGILFFTLLSSGIVFLLFKGFKIDLPETISGLLQFIFFILFVWLYISAVERRSFRSLGFFGNRKIHDYSKGLFIGVLFVAISALVISTITKSYPVFSFEFNLNSILSVITVFGFFIIQGASEEIVFRGWFMQSISVRHWPWLGFVLSTVIFALVHMANPNFSLVAGLNILLIGFFLALLILFDGNIWSACGFHTAWNFSMNSIFGINVSGNKIMGESLMKTNFEGNPLVTGGEFGLEGSLLVSALIIISCIIVIVLKKSK